mgnify:FL=1
MSVRKLITYIFVALLSLLTLTVSAQGKKGKSHSYSSKKKSSYK